MVMESKEDKSVVIADRITLALEIIGWGLIGAVIFLVLLKVLGLIHSPQEITLDTVLTTGILVLLIDMRVKLGLLRGDFKKKLRFPISKGRNLPW